MLFHSTLHRAILCSALCNGWAVSSVCAIAVSMVRVAESVSQHSVLQPCALCWGRHFFFFPLGLFVSSLCNLFKRRLKMIYLKQKTGCRAFYFEGTVHIFCAAGIILFWNPSPLANTKSAVINKTLLWSIIDYFLCSSMKFSLCWLAGEEEEQNNRYLWLWMMFKVYNIVSCI